MILDEALPMINGLTEQVKRLTVKLHAAEAERDAWRCSYEREKGKNREIVRYNCTQCEKVYREYENLRRSLLRVLVEETRLLGRLTVKDLGLLDLSGED